MTENKKEIPQPISITPPLTESDENTNANIYPGMTVPIYEDEQQLTDTTNIGTTTMDPRSPQKLGSYRSRAGKFSNTLSNLLPTISAKLHHSKKGSKNSPNSNSNPQINIESKPAQTEPAKAIVTTIGGIPMDATSQLSSSQDYENLIHFPDSSNYLGTVNAPRSSNDSFTRNSNLMSQFSRTRNNTISSQLSAISSIPPSQTPSVLWQNNNDNQYQMLQQFSNPTINELPINTNNNTNHLQEYQNNNNNSNNNPFFDPNNNVGTPRQSLSQNNAMSNLSIWPNSNPRQRSQSNTSSIYADNAIFEQQQQHVSRQRAATTYSIPPVQEIPPVVDDIDPRSLNWVTTDKTVPFVNQIQTLLPTDTISISNIFSLQQQQTQLANAINLTSTSLVTLCSKYGNVLSSRTLKGLNLALVEFDTVDSAARALDGLQNKEVSMIGAPSTVCFAKILPMHQPPVTIPTSNTPLNGQVEALPQTLLQEQLYNGALSFQQQGNQSIPIFTQHIHQNQNSNNNHNHNNIQISNNEKEQCPFPLPPPKIANQKEALKETVDSFSVEYDEEQIKHILLKAFQNGETADTNDFGPLPNPLSSRDFDSPKLRELRKSIDANQMSDLEIEQLAMAMLDELPELSSDYIGNTIVQKLFDHSSDIIKDIMLRKTNKYLTSMGVHKNGTWACQKMITMATTPRQKMLVGKGVEAYCTALFNDQFGNYVIQCVLKYGFPWNNFIFESIVANFWTIAQNRYGARAVRACLEAHDIVTKEQTLILSGMIILYAEYLTTNTNGTLLVTWFLDTCILPQRHTILAKKIVSHIVELCCHRLASLTVLKILNFRGDDEARNIILNAIFGPYYEEDVNPPSILITILSNTNYGPTFVYKVLSMPLLEGDVRLHVIRQVRKVLSECKAAQHHRRLMEEVGLAQLNGVQQNTQGKHRVSMSHVFNHENGKHMRHLSVSSARSNNSRQNIQVPNAQIPSNGQAPNMIPGLSASPVQMMNQVGGQPNGQAYNMNYMNYPNIYPANSGSGNYHNMNDDINSQFDKLTINNDN